MSGLRGDPGTWAYNASKAAVINLVRGLAIDYAAQHIRINTSTRTGVKPGRTLSLRPRVAGRLADSVRVAMGR